MRFPLFGAAHLAVIGGIPATAALAAWMGRRSARAANAVRIGLGLFLLIDELAWYVYIARSQGLQFPGGLPLDLSDFIVWSTILAALTRRRAFFEFSYFAGIAGAGMAVLTPDLSNARMSYELIHFFLAHGFSVVTVLALLWMHQARIGRGAMWRAFGMLNALALCLGIFDWRFGTNYMFLRDKPEAVSLLTYFGKWPVYIFAADALALGLFSLLAMYAKWYDART